MRSTPFTIVCAALCFLAAGVAQADPSAHVAIGVGHMADRTRTRGVDLGSRLRDALLAQLRAAQVTILPERPSPALARSFERRGMSRYFLEGSVSNLETHRLGFALRVRCQISLMVLEDPSRELRMVLSSAASAEQQRVIAGRESGLQTRAVEGAVQGVFARLIRTLSARSMRTAATGAPHDG